MPLSGAARQAVVDTIDRWASSQLDGNPVVAAVDSDPSVPVWFVRTRGEDREFTTVWFTLRQRTLHVETQFMPAPESARAEVFEYLLRRNTTTAPLRFAIGDEDAVYLVGEAAVEAVDDDLLDAFLGAAWHHAEACFSTAMTIGFPGRYRRRPRPA